MTGKDALDAVYRRVQEQGTALRSQLGLYAELGYPTGHLDRIAAQLDVVDEVLSAVRDLNAQASGHNWGNEQRTA
jgi:hypothetical protein